MPYQGNYLQNLVGGVCWEWGLVPDGRRKGYSVSSGVNLLEFLLHGLAPLVSHLFRAVSSDNHNEDQSYWLPTSQNFQGNRSSKRPESGTGYFGWFDISLTFGNCSTSKF